MCEAFWVELAGCVAVPVVVGAAAVAVIGVSSSSSLEVELLSSLELESLLLEFFRDGRRALGAPRSPFSLSGLGG